ncbi:MAG: hypothetical protein R2873_04175 [Caldilineaceae bacterium]
MVTYTLGFFNPADERRACPPTSYSNGDPANPQSGVTFQNVAWVDGCPGWLDLTLPPGSGTFQFTGTVGATGVDGVTSTSRLPTSATAAHSLVTQAAHRPIACR